MIDVVNVLDENNANKKLKELIKRVSDVVQADLKEFDRVIEDSKATVTVYGSEIGILGDQYIDGETVYTYAPTEPPDPPVPGTGISEGYYKSWRNGNQDKITLEDAWFRVTVSAYVEYEMYRSYIQIDHVDPPELVWGWGWIVYQTGGEGRNWLGYNAVGAAQWNVGFYTEYFSPQHPYVTVDVEVVAGGDSNQDSGELYL